MNNGNIMGRYAITPLVQVNGSYSNQMIKFLDQTASAAALLNTAVQSIETGAEYRMAPTQSIGASYQYQQMSFEPSNGVGAGYISVVHGAMVTWKSSLAREVTVEISPGASFLAGASADLYWTARVLLQWTDGRTTAGLSYSRALVPSLFVGASILISDYVTASVSHRLNSQWSVSAQSDYAHNNSVGQTALQFESLGQSVSVNYDLFAGMVVSASVSYNYFINGSATFESSFSREMALLSLRKQWD